MFAEIGMLREFGAELVKYGAFVDFGVFFGSVEVVQFVEFDGEASTTQFGCSSCDAAVRSRCRLAWALPLHPDVTAACGCSPQRGVAHCGGEGGAHRGGAAVRYLHLDAVY